MKFSRYISLAFAILMMGGVYLSIYPAVGVFPKEDMRINRDTFGIDDALLCHSMMQQGGVQIGLSRPIEDKDLLKALDSAKNIVYSVRSSALIFIDIPEREDYLIVQKLFERKYIVADYQYILTGLSRPGSFGEMVQNSGMNPASTNDSKNGFDRSTSGNFFDNVEATTRDAFVTRCAVLPDSKFSEIYWAAKGTSVLHHWAHLFQPVLADVSGEFVGKKTSPHAQYGYIVPYVASKAANLFFDNLGPTSLVRSAWLILLGCAIIFCFLYFYLLGYSVVSSIFFILVPYSVMKIGPFAFNLSPGFHLFRELAVMLVALPLFWFVSEKRFPRSFLLLFSPLIIGLAYLFDPMFSLISLVAIFVVAFAMYDLWRWIFRHPLSSLLIVSAATCFATFYIIFINFSSVEYVASKLVFGDYGLITVNAKHLAFILFVDFLVLLFAYLWYARGNRDEYWALGVFFGFVFLFSNFYYLITPDSFHFYKLVGISSLFFSSSALAFRRIRYFSDAIGLGRQAILLSVFFVISGTSILNSWLRPTPKVELSLEIIKDVDLSSHLINGRLIRGSLSPALTAKLNYFPADQKFDFLISAHDKYLLFSHGVGNGFGVPDFVMSLDSTASYNNALRTLYSNSDFSVLLDSELATADFTYGISRFHPVLGWGHYASKINSKSWMRVRDIVLTIKEKCTLISATVTGWERYRCSKLSG